MDEHSYIEGSRRVWLMMLQQCLIHLGVDDPVTGRQRWLLERQETLAMLRQVCEQHGDQDWTDDLYIPDILEKHLWRHLGQ
jgi:hypothetical protein